MNSDAAAQNLFDRWVLAVIPKLRELPHGDGAFAALSMAFGLYERFIDSKLHKAGINASSDNFRIEAAKDMGMKEADAWIVQRFWDGFRLGMQHAFQPKAYIEQKGNGDRWGWDISEKVGYHGYPEVIQSENDLFIVTLDPWKFLEHVLQRWKENPDLTNQLSEFEFGKIRKTDQSQKSSNSLNPAIQLSNSQTGIYPAKMK